MNEKSLITQRDILARIVAQNTTCCYVCPAKSVCHDKSGASTVDCSRVIIDWVENMVEKWGSMYGY